MQPAALPALPLPTSQLPLPSCHFLLINEVSPISGGACNLLCCHSLGQVLTASSRCRCLSLRPCLCWTVVVTHTHTLTAGTHLEAEGSRHNLQRLCRNLGRVQISRRRRRQRKVYTHKYIKYIVYSVSAQSMNDMFACLRPSLGAQ